MKVKRLFVIIAALMLVLCVPATAFADSFSANTFNDVAAADWYYSGVKAAYDNGLMIGVGNQRFAPNSTFTLAEAITICSRLHADYNGKAVRALQSGEKWYQPYYDYALENALLSEQMKKVTAIDTVPASRAEAAYLFHKVLSAKEKTPLYINTSTVYDLNEVPAVYQTAVSEMFKLGIFLGMTPGHFQGNSSVTRAQIATILNRVTDKQERIPYDDKYLNELSGQEGNMQMYDGYMVYDDAYTYFSTGIGDGENRCDIVKRDNRTLQSKLIYTGNGNLSNLLLKDNKLFFSERIETNYYVNQGGYQTLITDANYIVCYDLSTDQAYCLYSTEQYSRIYSFAIYGNNIYICRSNRNGDYEARIDVLDSQGNISTLVYFNTGGMIPEDIAIFDGKIYFMATGMIQSSNGAKSSIDGLHYFDLKTQTISDIIPVTTDVSISGVQLANGILYVAEGDRNPNGYTSNYHIYKYNTVTGSSYKNDRTEIYQTTTSFVFSVVESNVYLSNKNSSCVYKLLGDGSTRAVFDAEEYSPLNFVISSKQEYFYMKYYTPAASLYSTFNSNHSRVSLANYLGVNKGEESGSVRSAAKGSSESYPSLDDITISNDYKTVYYSWQDKYGTETLSLDINTGLYSRYKNEPRSEHLKTIYIDGSQYTIADYAHYANNKDDDFYLNTIANTFNNLKNTKSYTELEWLQSIANFVQYMPYVSDDIGTGYDDYPKYPVETLFDRGGDCEDSSILLASIYEELGYDCVLLHTPGHMSIGLNCQAEGYYHEENDIKYYYVETTCEGYDIGVIPYGVGELLFAYQVD